MLSNDWPVPGTRDRTRTSSQGIACCLCACLQIMASFDSGFGALFMCSVVVLVSDFLLSVMLSMIWSGFNEAQQVELAKLEFLYRQGEGEYDDTPVKGEGDSENAEELTDGARVLVLDGVVAPSRRHSPVGELETVRESPHEGSRSKESRRSPGAVSVGNGESKGGVAAESKVPFQHRQPSAEAKGQGELSRISGSSSSSSDDDDDDHDEKPSTLTSTPHLNGPLQPLVLREFPPSAKASAPLSTVRRLSQFRSVDMQSSPTFLAATGRTRVGGAAVTPLSPVSPLTPITPRQPLLGTSPGASAASAGSQAVSATAKPAPRSPGSRAPASPSQSRRPDRLVPVGALGVRQNSAPIAVKAPSMFRQSLFKQSVINVSAHGVTTTLSKTQLQERIMNMRRNMFGVEAHTFIRIPTVGFDRAVRFLRATSARLDVCCGPTRAGRIAAGLHRFGFRALNSEWFTVFGGLLVLANIALLAAAHYPMTPSEVTDFDIANFVLTVLFVVDMAIRLMGMGMAYFR